MTRPFSDNPAATATPVDEAPGKVWFIGAGPGAPDLITVRGQRLIREADLVLYAGSLVPVELLQEAGMKPASRCIDSSTLTLEETHALCLDTASTGGMVARVHTGDPSLYGALREQARLLDRDGIAWGVVPGITASFAAAAAAGCSFTVPEVTQTLVITRLAGRTPVPEAERLRELARHGSSMAIYLSAQDADAVQAELAIFPGDTPVVCASKVGWLDERLVRTTVAELAETVRAHGLTRQTVFLVLPGESVRAADSCSKLYDAGFAHGYRS